MEGDQFAIDLMMLGPCSDLAAIVACDRATARVADASDRDAAHLEVASTGANHFAAMGRSIAEPDDIAHIGCSSNPVQSVILLVSTCMPITAATVGGS